MNNISIMYLLHLAWKRIWVLVAAMIVFAMVAFGYCKFFATRHYSARSSIIVTNGGIVTEEIEDVKSTINGADISASISLANSVTELLKTRKVYDAFVDEYGEKYNVENGAAVKGMVSVVKRENNIPFIDITVTSTDPAKAKDIANDIADFSCKYIVKEYFKKAQIVTADQAEGVSLVSPRTLYTTGLASIIGVILAFVVVLIFDSLNQAIRGEEEFSMKFDIPVIGTVPDFGDTEVPGNYYYKRGGRKNGTKKAQY